MCLTRTAPRNFVTIAYFYSARSEPSPIAVWIMPLIKTSNWTLISF